MEFQLTFLTLQGSLWVGRCPPDWPPTPVRAAPWRTSGRRPSSPPASAGRSFSSLDLHNRTDDLSVRDKGQHEGGGGILFWPSAMTLWREKWGTVLKVKVQVLPSTLSQRFVCQLFVLKNRFILWTRRCPAPLLGHAPRVRCQEKGHETQFHT